MHEGCQRPGVRAQLVVEVIDEHLVRRVVGDRSQHGLDAARGEHRSQHHAGADRSHGPPPSRRYPWPRRVVIRSWAPALRSFMRSADIALSTVLLLGKVSSLYRWSSMVSRE